MTTPHLDPRQQHILKVIEDAGVSQDLTAIRQLLHQPARADELMPLVGGLVVAGYLQKVPGRPDARRGPADRSYQAVQFRLTDQGRARLHSRPVTRRVAPAPSDAADG